MSERQDLALPEPPKEGRWISRPKRSRWILQMGAFAGFVGQLPNLLHLILKPWLGEMGSWIGTFVFFFLLLGLGAFFFFRERFARRLLIEDLALVDGAFGHQYPAEVTIVVEGKRLGTDRGVIWFADGLMGFSGSSSSFVLAGRDVEFVRTARAKTSKRSALPAASILLVDPPVPSHLTINALGGHDKELRERILAFEVTKAPFEGERFWPPLKPFDDSPALSADTVRA